MNRAFRSKAHASGTDVLTGIRVESIDTAEGNCQLKISTLSREEALIRPARLVVATNALGSTLIAGIDVEPAVNHVLVTDEIPDFEFPTPSTSTPDTSTPGPSRTGCSLAEDGIGDSMKQPRATC